MLVEVEEDEGRELPDGFLRAGLAEAAAGKAAADGEGQRDEFRVSRHQRAGRATIAPTSAPVYGPGDEAGEEGPFERQVGAVIVRGSLRNVTPAVSGTPSASVNTSRSSQPRRSKIRMWRNRR